MRNKNQQNQDGEASRRILPEKSNQERTGGPPKKVSLDSPRKEEPVSEGNLSAPPSLPAEKEKEKDNGPPAKIEMAEGRLSGRSIGAVGGSGRVGHPGRGGNGGRLWRGRARRKGRIHAPTRWGEPRPKHGSTDSKRKRSIRPQSGKRRGAEGGRQLAEGRTHHGTHGSPCKGA